MGRTKIPLCNHVKANGTVCESPALQDKPFCFFHAAAHDRVKRQRRAARHKLPFQLPLLEDAESVQLAIGDTLNALLSGQIDHKTAGLILYGLQTAAGNIRHTKFRIYESSRKYDYYHNQEEEFLEEEIQEEIAAESATANAMPADHDAEDATRPASDDAGNESADSCHPEESVSSTSGPSVPENTAASQPDLPPKKSPVPTVSAQAAREKA
jgi:hypothetical protein